MFHYMNFWLGKDEFEIGNERKASVALFGEFALSFMYPRFYFYTTFIWFITASKAAASTKLSGDIESQATQTL